jgi:hypothetical protein
MTRSKFRILSLLAVGVIGILVPATGCQKPDDGMSAEQQKKTDRIDEIAKKSDGNWDKVSQEDRDYLLKNVTSGSESAAKMLLLGKAGKLGMGAGKGGPGGPPGSPGSGAP